ncbi:MAG: pore-forming ESAT-6 family protein [Anaerorhabdus sp.]
MEEIKISLSDVSLCASTIRSLNQQMMNILQNIKKEMNDLNSAWISDGGEAIRQQFNTFSTRFDQQKEIIDRYSTFLDFTVTSYDSLETTITSNATSIQT